MFRFIGNLFSFFSRWLGPYAAVVAYLAPKAYPVVVELERRVQPKTFAKLLEVLKEWGMQYLSISPELPINVALRDAAAMRTKELTDKYGEAPEACFNGAVELAVIRMNGEKDNASS